ncbi:MAG: hypothetical protein HQK83_11675 [Fibrobacteria bacterium]|nr:hypothetical protein [Fibrobacteria bacterium]
MEETITSTVPETDSPSARWTELKAAVKKSRLAKFQEVYCLSLLQYGEELEICGRKKSADMLFEKAKSHFEPLSQKTVVNDLVNNLAVAKLEYACESPFYSVDLSLLQQASEQLISVVNGYKDIFPKAERDFLEQKIKRLCDKAANAKIGKSMFSYYKGELACLHEEVLACIGKRNDDERMKTKESEPGTSVSEQVNKFGIYNKQFNVNLFFELLGKSDKHWIHQIKNHYQEFQKLLSLIK